MTWIESVRSWLPANLGGNVPSSNGPTQEDLLDESNAALRRLGNVTAGDTHSVDTVLIHAAIQKDGAGNLSLLLRANNDRASLTFLNGKTVQVNIDGQRSLIDGGKVVLSTGASSKVVRGPLPTTLELGKKISFGEIEVAK